jgi:hypothetical protein
MVWIASNTVSGSSTSIVTFSGIPQTFTHLQVRAFVNYTATTSGDYQLSMTYNGDWFPNSNNSFHQLSGPGVGSGFSSGATSTWNMYIANLGGTNSSGGAQANVTPNTSIFQVAIIDVLDYANTNKNKTMRAIAGYDANGVGSVFLSSGARYTTTAVTSLSLGASGNSTNLLAGTRFDLYGITTSSVTGA